MSNTDFDPQFFDPRPMGPGSILFSDPGGALSQRDPILSLGRDQAMVDAKAAADRAEQSIGDREDFMRRRAAALSPLRDAQARAAAQPAPSPPQAQQPPKVPTMEDAQQQTWQQEWLTAAMFLGALAGGATRRPLTNSLAAFTGMVEGYNNGQKQKFDQSMRTWEAENKRVQEANDQANKAYDRILKARDLDNEQKLLMLQIEAARWDDQPMAQAATTRDRIAVAQLHDQRLRYGAELRGAQGRRDEEQQQRAVQWVNGPEGIRRAQAIANYQLPAPSTLGRTGYQGALNTELMNKVLELNPSYDATLYGGKQSAARVEATIDPMTVRRTEIAFSAGVEARSVRSLNVAVDHLSVLEKLSTALKNGDINVINKYKNYLQTEIGAAAPTNFNAAKQIIGQEIVKAVVNNGGGVTERQEAARYVSDAKSPDQLIGLVRTYERLMAGQLHGLQQQYEGGGGRKDFNAAFLRPETRETLERIFSADIPQPSNELADHLQRLAEKIQSGAGTIAGAAAGAVERSTPGPDRPAAGTLTSQIPGYSRGRGRRLPQGWSLTPME